MSPAPRISPPPGPWAARGPAGAGWGVFAAVFLLLAGLLTFTGRESFFRTAFYEEGDDAANALQIHRAKHFHELHGNYSRWNFHHPGPAFFYAYAGGEWLLHDVTGLAPAPRNAHLYTGTLVQLAFYALAIALLARRARQPWLVAALAVAAGALHFVHVERVLFSVWPPDVLLMPFLCFVVACAAVASGDHGVLPVFVVAGGFLVHGHIAQPLFVGPLAALAIVLAWRGPWRGRIAEVSRSRAGLAAFAILAVFLLPLGLDLLAGRDSNAAAVLRHLRFQRDHGQTLWQSVLCYTNYFAALNDPTGFTELSPGNFAALRTRGWVLALWPVLLGFAAVQFFRRAPRDDETAAGRAAPFGRPLLIVWAVASGLTLFWGMKQDGGFTNFNSHFNHTLVHVLALAAILALGEILRPLSRRVAWLALGAATLWFALVLPFDANVGSRGDEAALRLPALLRADPRPAAPKLITFAGDSWYEAVTLARAFQRLGLEFHVHPTWSVMFGEDKVFAGTVDQLGRGDLSVWHVVRPPLAPKGAHVLNREASVVFPNTAPVTLPFHLGFSPGEAARLPMFGLTPGDEGWTWTEGHLAAIVFSTADVDRDVVLTLDASGYIPRNLIQTQHAVFHVNGQEVGRAEFNETRREIRLTVPRAVWNRQSPRVILFVLPDALSPAAAGVSGDPRQIGLRVNGLTISVGSE